LTGSVIEPKKTAFRLFGRYFKHLTSPDPSYPLVPFNNLDHRVPLELFGEVAFEYLSLLASNLGKKVSTNPGAIHLPARAKADNVVTASTTGALRG
jgi:hypothetical protein